VRAVPPESAADGNSVVLGLARRIGLRYPGPATPVSAPPRPLVL